MTTRNDPRQYDALAEQWWDPHGSFAMLHWLAKARGALIPEPAEGASAPLLVDVGCGGGLNAPYARRYHHLGVDIRPPNLRQARDHGLRCVRGDVTRLPLRDRCADVVIAGEILEHVDDWRATVDESCRVLKPGGTLIIDTLARTLTARLVAIGIAERLPGGPPPGIHDPTLFIKPAELVEHCARHGVDLRVWGVRPAAGPMVRWLIRRRGAVPMVPVSSKSVLYAGTGVKHA